MHVRQLDSLEAQKRVLDTGLLYAINATILHPVGLALAFVYDEHQQDVPIGIHFVRTTDGGPWSFSTELEAEGKAKLKAFIADQDLPLINEHFFNELLNGRSEPADFEENYQPSEFRSLMGVETLSPVIVRDRNMPYVTYAPFTRKDLITGIAGCDRKRPGRIVHLLTKAWTIDHPQDEAAPEIISLPHWLVTVWTIVTAEMAQPTTYVGHIFISNSEDRIYLTHGTN